MLLAGDAPYDAQFRSATFIIWTAGFGIKFIANPQPIEPTRCPILHRRPAQAASVAIGRSGSSIHSLQEPTYRRGSG